MTDNSLAIEQPAGQELALPEHITESARDYRREALSPRTRQAYADAWKLFEEWCFSMGRRSMPASASTVAAWAVALADGHDGRKPRATKTIQLYVTAVIFMHRTAGHPLSTKDAEIRTALAGIARTKAKTQLPRKAAPLMGKDLFRMLGSFDPERPADARDGALLALGWSGAARRSEVVCLDWQQLGTGTGFVRVDERGVEVVLMTSKASQDTAVSIAIPAEDMPAAKEWLETWARVADLQPGQAIFRPVDRVGRIAEERMMGRSVSDIVKRRIGAFGRTDGKSVQEVGEMMRRYSGHSLRRGFCTTAADQGVELERLAAQSRHATLETLRSYIDTANRWQRSALKGVGF
jgi:integrase